MLSALLTVWEGRPMHNSKIQQIWNLSYEDFCSSGYHQSDIQRKTSLAILNCKSGKLGCNISICQDCGHTDFHNNSCRNRNCPNCQAILKEVWVDRRRAEVIDSPYFHIVFTMSTCTVSFPGAGFPPTGKYTGPARSFLSLSGSWGTSSRESILHFWIPFTRTGSSFFPLPVKNSPGVHTTFFNACASFRLSENPLLWLFEQPYQNQKPETYLQTTGWTTFPAQVCRSVHGRTSESSMGFRYQYLPHMWLPKHEACGKDSCKTLLKLWYPHISFFRPSSGRSAEHAQNYFYISQ